MVMKAWQKPLQRWLDAGLIDAAAATRISDFEQERETHSGRRWPVLLAWIFGGLLLCAGVLLFVAAHWDRLAPGSRFSLVLLMVLVFHLAGALLQDRASVLAIVLHAVGTVTLGAGIFLAGQIFHLQEHWPGGVMLWAAGALIAWALLRDSIQMALAAVLTPMWLAGEWMVATEHVLGGERILAVGLWLLALVYLSARSPERDTPTRRFLTWTGGLALLPLTSFIITSRQFEWNRDDPAIPAGLVVLGWIVALSAPLMLAVLLRRRDAWPVAIGGAWAVLLAMAAGAIESDYSGNAVTFDWHEIATYALCALGSLLMAWWGLVEGRRERINLGVLGFGLTVVFFYFANLMDKLERSLSLMVLGLLFLVGGYLLERARRTLISKLSGSSS
jgi:uncharacterized membrane protein